ncbi:zinc ribbon domain-containing protein [Infirmifilum lucidum]|uniref:Zinc ribbon domain-containing protein n=1 Tax=Infirmifilum lucidum TaxID=2776706 RepID=A0A7L9FJ81_9CREN|nr:zinc ribbon domain-containing protein [Infirmifilum lucidum]QOJ78956.1 zinc ribbon domain-containing protein [Infirmifilum lucidum]
MPGLVRRRFEAGEKVKYDETRDAVYLEGGYRGVSPIVGVRSIYSDPDVAHFNDLMAFDEVLLNGDALVRGSVLSEARVRFSSTVEEPAVVFGDVGTIPSRTEGEEHARERSLQIEGKSPTVIFGNVITGNLYIRSPSVIVGNVLALRELKIEAESVILGRILVGSKVSKGKAYIENSTFYHVYAYGDVTLGPGNTTMLPIIASRGGRIELKADTIRVLGLPCIYCPVEQNPFLCSRYREQSCPLVEKGLGFDYLSEFDLAKSGEYEYVSWFWRSSPAMVLQNVLVKKVLYTALALSKNVLFDLKEKRINGLTLSTYVSQYLRDVREKAGGGMSASIEEVRRSFFKILEEYFQSRKLPYVTCSKCGMPNPPGVKICIYCGSKVS